MQCLIASLGRFSLPQKVKKTKIKIDENGSFRQALLVLLQLEAATNGDVAPSVELLRSLTKTGIQNPGSTHQL